MSTELEAAAARGDGAVHRRRPGPARARGQGVPPPAEAADHHPGRGGGRDGQRGGRGGGHSREQQGPSARPPARRSRPPTPPTSCGTLSTPWLPRASATWSRRTAPCSRRAPPCSRSRGNWWVHGVVPSWSARRGGRRHASLDLPRQHQGCRRSRPADSACSTGPSARHTGARRSSTATAPGGPRPRPRPGRNRAGALRLHQGPRHCPERRERATAGPPCTRSQLACGAYRVAGRQVIDGINTIKITGDGGRFHVFGEPWPTTCRCGPSWDSARPTSAGSRPPRPAWPS